MNNYGSVLTGREFGKQTFDNLKLDYPVSLDFSGVNTLGSSYADEVFVPIAKKQMNKITVLNVNSPVRDCIKDVAIDNNISVTFE
jgi:hypothetical protein